MAKHAQQVAEERVLKARLELLLVEVDEAVQVPACAAATAVTATPCIAACCALRRAAAQLHVLCRSLPAIFNAAARARGE